MEYSSMLDEVDLAWDNLQEAKSVLQQIENKLNSEEDDLLPEPSIRKCLQSKALGCSVKNTSNLSNKGSPHRLTSTTNHRLNKCRTLSPEWTPSSSRSNNNGKFNYKLENCGSSRRMFGNERTDLSHNIIGQDTQLSGVIQTMITIDQKPSDNPSTRVIPTRLQMLTDCDVSEKSYHKATDVCSRSNVCYLEGGPPVGNGANLTFDCCSQRQMLQETKNSPEPLVAVSSLGLPGSPFIQCLELKRNKSPTNKLERLKERIRVQRKLQKEQQFARTNSNLPQEQPIPVLRQKTHTGGSEKCLVRKVTFAPPAPAYKGFNAIKFISEEEREEEVLAVTPQPSRRGLMRRRSYGHQEADNSLRISIPEQRRNHQQNPSSNHEAICNTRSCSKTQNLKETAKVNGSYSSDVFSWKQGQKLIRMLLGPAPKLPKSPATTQGTHDRTSQYLSDEQVTDPVEHAESSSFERSPRRRLYFADENDQHCNSKKTGSLDSEQPCLETMQVNGTLKGLRSEKTAGINQNSTWKMGDGSPNLEGKCGEDGQKSVVIPKGHDCLLPHEDEQAGPNHWSSNSPRNCFMRQKPHSGGKRRSSLPKHRSGSSSPLLNKADTENHEDRARSAASRSYNAAEVREYMNRQVVKRKRKESERKRSARQALEMKKKRLQEVYRKQKEAISKQKRWKQRGILPAQHFVDRCKESTNPGKSLGSAQLMKDQTPTKGRPESGDLEESVSQQQEMKYPMGPLRHLMPGQCSPLRIQDLEPLRRSPKLPTLSRLANQPLATREQETSCNATFHRSFECRSKQRRIEALRSMATALSGRIEDEVKRLGVESGSLQSPGRCSSNQEWIQDVTGRPVGATLAGGCGEWESVPFSCPVLSPSVPTGFSLRPNSLYKREGQVEAGAPKDQRSGSKTDLEVKELVDELLCSSSSQSDDFLRSDSEPLTESEPVCKPRESSDRLLNGEKGLVDKCDALGNFSIGNHQLERKRKAEIAFDAHHPESWSLGRRGSWETRDVQDGNKSSLSQKSKRFSSHWSPSRTMPTSPSGVTQTVRGKESAVIEHRYNCVRTHSPRNSRLFTQNGRPLDDSRPVKGTRKVTTNERVKGKEDPVTQRLAELMKQLQEETEELSFSHRMNSSLKEDSLVELKRSLVSPDSTEPLRNNRSGASAEISVDEEGTTHTLATSGSLMKDKLMEQSLWSLLPSESHYRQTMESMKNRRSRASGTQHEPSNSFSKWEETGRPIFGNQDAFSRFTLEMAHQYLKEEDLRARHQTALFRLREKALKEKTKAELAWLEHQKTHLQNKGQDDKRPVIIRKQREVLLKLQNEKAEIRHLQNAYRIAHQERKFLLKQQQEIFRIHQSTAYLQWQLGRSATGSWFPGVKDSLLPTAADEESTHLTGPEPDPEVGSSSPLSLSGSEGSSAMERPRETYHKLDERFLTKKEEELIRRRRQAMDVLAWKQPLDTEEPVVHRTGLANWTPWVRDQVPGTQDLSTETDNWNAEESLSSPESTKHDKVVTLAADFSLDELNEGKQKAKPAESMKQISAVVLEPSEKLVMQATTIQSENDDLISGTAAEPTAGETCTSPLRRELANRKEMMGIMRREQRRRQREKLKMEEAELCRQLEAYDVFIRRTQAELFSDSDVNEILKPQIKTPTAGQHKSQVDFSWPQRPNLLQHSPERGAVIAQAQDLPSEQGEKAKEMAQALKPGAVDLPSPGQSENDKKATQGIDPQLLPPSNPVDEMQGEENHPEIVKPFACPESPGSLDLATKQSDPPTNSKEEIIQLNRSDYSACNTTKSSNVPLPKTSSAEQNAAISPSKQRKAKFQSTSQLHPNDFWNNLPTKAADNSSQTFCPHLVINNTMLNADQGEKCGINQSSTVVMNAEDIKENKFGFLIHSVKISGVTPSSNQQPPLELRPNRPASEVGCQETIAAESPTGKTDGLPEQASGSPLLKSNCSLKEDAGLAHCQQTLSGDSRTAEGISPASFLSFIDDLSSSEDKSEGMDKVSLRKREVQSPMKGTLCTSEAFPLLPKEAISLRSEAVKEGALRSKDQAPLAEGIAVKSVELSFLNAEGQQGLLPVLKSSCKKKVLAIPLIDSSTQKEQVSPVDEISFINKELPSPIEEDNMLSVKELNSLVDELMLYETETSLPPAEAGISFETEEFPPPLEGIIMCRSKELPSPSRENGIVRIEDLAPSSAGNTFIYESSVGDQNCTDDFTPPPTIEEIVEERKGKVTEKCKCPLGTSWDKETPTHFCGDSLLLEPSRIHLPQTEQQMVNPLRCFTIRNQVLVDNEPDSLKFKGYTSFDQDYWAGTELDKPEGELDGAFCGLKYFECTKKYDIFDTPEELSHQWDNFDVNTDVTDSVTEDSFSDGPPMLNQKSLDDDLKQAHSFEEDSEEKLIEKGVASQARDKRPVSDRGNQGKAHWRDNNDLELEQVILECAKAVESFVGSQTLLDAEVEATSHSDAHLNSEGLVCTWVQQHPVGNDSEQSVNDAEEDLTDHHVEGTLSKVTSIIDQENQSTQEMGEKKLRQNQIKQCSFELTQRNSQPVKGQKSHDRSHKEVTDLLRVDYMQLQGIIRIAKAGCSQESIENVTRNLITEIIDEATKEYKKIKRKQSENTKAKRILCPQPAVRCLTQFRMVHKAGISGNIQDISNEEPEGLQPFLGTKTRGQKFLLDYWCSAPWRPSEEPTFVVPHNFTDIQQLVGNAVNALWNQHGQLQVGNEINVLECQKDKDTDEMDADGKSKRAYKKAIFDLTSDIFRNAIIKEPKTKLDPWMKPKPQALPYSDHSLNKEDKTEVTSFIQDKVTKLLNLDRNDLGKRRRIQKLTKYNRSKRDRVDIILIQELQEEESHWVEYADDELAVKMKLTEDVFNILIHDTADILSTIYGKKLAEKEFITSTS